MTYSRHVRLPVLAVMVAACGTERPPAGTADTTRIETTTTSPSSAIPAGWRAIAWEPHAGVDPSDPGIGVVVLRRAEDKSGTLGADTLVLRAAPDAASPPVGAMVFVVSTNGVTSYRVIAPDSLTPNLIEYGYEESGVPFDSVDASGRWLHALLGTAPNGIMLTGWVDSTQAGVGTARWVDQLRDRPIFFPKPERVAFFATPDSTRPVSAPRGGDDEYAIYPVEVRGPWMQVRLVIPSDNCTGPDSVPRRTRRAWIRYLDDRGRPNVWYYTRGC